MAIIVERKRILETLADSGPLTPYVLVALVSDVHAPGSVDDDIEAENRNPDGELYNSALGDDVKLSLVELIGSGLVEAKKGEFFLSKSGKTFLRALG